MQKTNEQEVRLDRFSAFLMKEVHLKNEKGLEGIKLRFVAVINAINTVIDQIIFLHDSVRNFFINIFEGNKTTQYSSWLRDH